MRNPRWLVAGAATLVAGCYPSYEFDLGEDAGGSCGAFELPALSSFTDDFGDGTPSPSWTSWAGDCAHEMGGQLVCAPPAGMHAYCGFGTVMRST